MVASAAVQALVEGGQERRGAPVIDGPLDCGAIVMRAHDYCPAVLSMQLADHVGEIFAFDPLLVQKLATAGACEQLFDTDGALGVTVRNILHRLQHLGSTC